MDDEEDVLLPRPQAVLSRTRLRALGPAWEVVRRTAPTHAHPVVPWGSGSRFPQDAWSV